VSSLERPFAAKELLNILLLLTPPPLCYYISQLSEHAEMQYNGDVMKFSAEARALLCGVFAFASILSIYRLPKTTKVCEKEPLEGLFWLIVMVIVLSAFFYALRSFWRA
jgi:hypothetical protein